MEGAIYVGGYGEALVRVGNCGHRPVAPVAVPVACPAAAPAVVPVSAGMAVLANVVMSPVVGAADVMRVTHLQVAPLLVLGSVPTAGAQATGLLLAHLMLLSLFTPFRGMMTCPMWPPATVNLNMSSSRGLLPLPRPIVTAPVAFLFAMAMPLGLHMSVSALLAALTTLNRKSLVWEAMMSSMWLLLKVPTLSALELTAPAMLLLSRQLLLCSALVSGAAVLAGMAVRLETVYYTLFVHCLFLLRGPLMDMPRELGAFTAPSFRCSLGGAAPADC